MLEVVWKQTNQCFNPRLQTRTQVY